MNLDRTDADYWGIPTLDLAMQATAEDLALPWVKWGTIGRRTIHRGGYHFYTHDYKFRTVDLFPAMIPRVGCVCAVEVNYSTVPEMPRARALYDVCRKRATAVAWQGMGVRVLVDLDVDPAFRGLALLGVPAGWWAYATRAHRGIEMREIDEDRRAACDRAGSDDVLFAVFGGGVEVRRLCEGRGWHWVAEDADAARGRPHGRPGLKRGRKPRVRAEQPLGLPFGRPDMPAGG